MVEYTEVPQDKACQLCGAVVYDTVAHDKFHDGLDAAATLIQQIYKVLPKEEQSNG